MTTLREALASLGRPGSVWADARRRVTLGEAVRGSVLGTHREALRGRSVAIAVPTQLEAALALVDLDGHAGRITLCTPDCDPAQLTRLAADAEVDAFIVGPDGPTGSQRVPAIAIGTIEAGCPRGEEPVETEWLLMTSGTSGPPKLAVHTLAGLVGAIGAPRPAPEPTVWSTFYDIRRYGGLQIFLRALFGGASLVFSAADEPVGDFLFRLARESVTHLSGTPSHWRRALMSGQAGVISPAYVRMSGEIADQAILDALRGQYPNAAVGHAFASTEAGVAFAVDDGREGFPAELVGSHGPVELAVRDGSLLIRSTRTARRYAGRDVPTLVEPDGFVDTGDLVELRGNRYHFVGRSTGGINVGGLKLHPEEVESVINAHPEVEMSLARARRNPITGAIVVAEVVLKASEARGPERLDELRREITARCRAELPAHKVPAVVSIVPSLAMSPGGKLARTRA